MSDPLADFLADHEAQAQADDPLAQFLAEQDSSRALPHAPGFARSPGPWQNPDERHKIARIERENEAGYTAPPTFLQKLATAADSGPPERIRGMHPDFGTRAVSSILRYMPAAHLDGQTPPTPEQTVEQLANIQDQNPGLIEAARGVQNLQRDLGGMALGGAATAAMGATRLPGMLPRAAPYIADAVGGLFGSAGSGGGPVEAATSSLGAAGLGKVLRVGGAGAGAGAERIKQSPSALGSDIQVLEKHGYTPSPMPGRPVTSMTPEVDYGPNLPRSPSEAQALPATSAGRGESGNLSARRFDMELDTADRLSQERFDRRAWRQDQPPGARVPGYAPRPYPGGEGPTDISTEPLLPAIDAELADPAAEIMPGVRGQMSTLRTALTRDTEPTVDIHHAPVEGYVPKQGPHAPLVPSAEINSFENIRRYADPHDVEGLHQLHQEHLAQERAGTRTSSVGRFGHEPPPEPVTDDQILSGAPPPPLPGPAGAPVSEDQIMSREPTAEAPPSGPAPHEALAQHLGIRRRLPTPDPLVGPPSVPLPPTQETVTTPRGTTGFRESPGGPLGYRARVIDADPLTSSPVNMGGAPADFTGHARVRSHLGEPTHKDAFIPSGESTVTSTVDRPRTASAGGVEPERVGIGDVRGRVTTPAERGLEALGPGNPPQHVRTVSDLNKIRQRLDEAGKVGEKEGYTLGEQPSVRMAGKIREHIRENAPKTAANNLRRHVLRTQNENTRALMKDAADIPESFGMQLAGQGEEGSKAVGNRAPRLREFAETFPTSSRMTAEEVQRLMDQPRLLHAQERLKLKKLPRIGGGGTDALNLASPVIGRGLYPFLRGVQGSGSERLAPYVPSMLRALQHAQERRREEEQR